MCSLFPALLLLGLLRTVLGSNDPLWDSNEDGNFRPQNITGLSHWLYGWRGTYYNGTVTMQMTVVDWTTEDDDDDKPCPAFLDQTLEISYDAVLAITKTVQGDENPIMMVLTPWQRGINLTTQRDTDYYRWERLPFRISSLPDYPRLGFPINSKRTWNISTSLTSDNAFSLAGAFNYDPKSSSNPWINLKFNHTSCSFSQTLYAGAILVPRNRRNRLKYETIKGPQLRGQFDNRSASLTIDGFFQVNPPSIPEEGLISGPIRIGFLGSVDASRSDDMLKPVNDTPMWNMSLGFDRDLSGKISAASRIAQGLSTTMFYAIIVLLVCLSLL
ncbi:uncharacterized protein PADG_02770 [Paracoccidioides brasiliensis Pb18]|uniref:Uncharacterized protein n=2 Tax=Paracoccidioides brasiliensis TaxID=121759 RepID=C1G6G5_PARBD|nr:uncharacterized protein PADG_02770 [Paracoccidioides brasiliensis Pb18]EEH46672.1 hypothetical protein PADG_02770 [Paracoccidioides brasiliensis Pb18]ODH15718.1 hypothetical protein ACO22_06413 [Paracoccidioides brasiliensis]ODH50343.1 hypothetical protein GX48_03458 [Paracoccidioides brasiliensis]